MRELRDFRSQASLEKGNLVPKNKLLPSQRSEVGWPSFLPASMTVFSENASLSRATSEATEGHLRNLRADFNVIRWSRANQNSRKDQKFCGL